MDNPTITLIWHQVPHQNVQSINYASRLIGITEIKATPHLIGCPKYNMHSNPHWYKLKYITYTNLTAHQLYLTMLEIVNRVINFPITYYIHDHDHIYSFISCSIMLFISQFNFSTYYIIKHE